MPPPGIANQGSLQAPQEDGSLTGMHLCESNQHAEGLLCPARKEHTGDWTQQTERRCVCAAKVQGLHRVPRKALIGDRTPPAPEP